MPNKENKIYINLKDGKIVSAYALQGDLRIVINNYNNQYIQEKGFKLVLDELKEECAELELYDLGEALGHAARQENSEKDKKEGEDCENKKE